MALKEGKTSGDNQDRGLSRSREQYNSAKGKGRVWPSLSPSPRLDSGGWVPGVID